MRQKTAEAKKLLEENGYGCVLISEDEKIFSFERGIKPLLKLEEQDKDFGKFVAADKIVGRAAAFIYLKLGVMEVFAQVLSEGAKKLFEENGVKVYFDTLTPRIINRNGDGICPMEKAVENSVGSDDAISKIKETLVKLSQKALTSGNNSDIIPKKK